MSQFFQTYVANSKKLIQNDQVTSGDNAAAAITLVTPARKRHYAVAILWSYTDAPTGGRLTISGLDGTSDTFDIDIDSAGWSGIALPPLASALGTDLIITLSAGGAGVVGKLNVFSVQMDGW